MIYSGKGTPADWTEYTMTWHIEAIIERYESSCSRRQKEVHTTENYFSKPKPIRQGDVDDSTSNEALRTLCYCIDRLIKNTYNTGHDEDQGYDYEIYLVDI